MLYQLSYTPKMTPNWEPKERLLKASLASNLSAY